MKKVKRYRKRRGTRVWLYNEWNADAYIGDLMINENTGKLFRIQESTGVNKRRSGELTLKEINPPIPNWFATLVDGEIWWCKKDNNN